MDANIVSPFWVSNVATLDSPADFASACGSSFPLAAEYEAIVSAMGEVHPVMAEALSRYSTENVPQLAPVLFRSMSLKLFDAFARVLKKSPVVRSATPKIEIPKGRLDRFSLGAKMLFASLEEKAAYQEALGNQKQALDLYFQIFMKDKTGFSDFVRVANAMGQSPAQAFRERLPNEMKGNLGDILWGYGAYQGAVDVWEGQVDQMEPTKVEEGLERLDYAGAVAVSLENRGELARAESFYRRAELEKEAERVAVENKRIKILKAGADFEATIRFNKWTSSLRFVFRIVSSADIPKIPYGGKYVLVESETGEEILRVAQNEGMHHFMILPGEKVIAAGFIAVEGSIRINGDSGNYWTTESGIAAKGIAVSVAGEAVHPLAPVRGLARARQVIGRILKCPVF
ncbi:MAG: hypothetical protein Q7T03_02605 [Deltaproteobacteria bacterium]|nr:hypothetical protein [Deltaproteobacteria bacterium]